MKEYKVIPQKEDFSNGFRWNDQEVLEKFLNFYSKLGWKVICEASNAYGYILEKDKK